MNSLWVPLLWAMASAPSEAAPGGACAEAAGASARADRLAELPREIRDDLKSLTKGEISDPDVPLLRSDAPTRAESRYATVRFVGAYRFAGTWLVQFEVALFAGVRTVGFVRRGDGRFERSPKVRFEGPACASIRAALAGVTAADGS